MWGREEVGKPWGGGELGCGRIVSTLVLWPQYLGDNLMDIQVETSSLGEGKRYRYRFGSHWHVERVQKHGQVRSLQESVLLEGELRTKFWFPYLEVRELKRQPATVTRNVTCSWPVKERGTQGETVHPVTLHVTLPTTLAGGCDR